MGSSLARYQYMIEHVVGDKMSRRHYDSLVYVYRGKRKPTLQYIRELIDKTDIVTSPLKKDFDWRDPLKHTNAKLADAVLQDGIIRYQMKGSGLGKMMRSCNWPL